MYLATLVCPTSMPSLSSSRWIRGAPPERVGNAHVTDQLTYLKRHGRPSAARPRLPAPVRSESMRCQRITVSGLIIASAARTSGNSRQRPTKITRSVLLKAGLFGPVRRRTLICWRSTRFSTSSADLERNRPTSAHQISLQTSLIADSINRFALARYWVRFAVGTGERNRKVGIVLILLVTASDHARLLAQEDALVGILRGPGLERGMRHREIGDMIEHFDKVVALVEHVELMCPLGGHVSPP